MLHKQMFDVFETVIVFCPNLYLTLDEPKTDDERGGLHKALFWTPT